MADKLGPRAVECWRKGARFWIVSGKEGVALAEPGEPIVYAVELPHLAGKTDDQLDDILRVKAVFGPPTRVIETTEENRWTGPSSPLARTQPTQ